MGGSGLKLPFWKVKREWQRLLLQLRAVPEAVWEPLFYARYNRRFPIDLVQHDGKAPLCKKVALVLIFPRPALMESTLLLCQGLIQAGYSPMIVANSKLRLQDLELLVPLAWRIVERPNLGHDFGGYRDGLWLLWRWGMTFDETLILNDSIWVLDGDGAMLLSQLQSVKADVAGCILRHRGSEQFLESYCYRISDKAFRAPRFREFWERLRLTSNKYKVIRRGERGHSAALLSAGLTLAPAHDLSKFRRALQGADTDLLAETLRFGAYLYDEDRVQAEQLVRRCNEEAWRDEALRFIDKALERGQFYSLFPVAARRLLDYPVLKRSGDRVARLWRNAFLSAVDAGVLAAPHPVILQEVRARVLSEQGVVDGS
jgi:hypothetical protein